MIEENKPNVYFFFGASNLFLSGRFVLLYYYFFYLRWIIIMNNRWWRCFNRNVRLKRRRNTKRNTLLPADQLRTFFRMISVYRYLMLKKDHFNVSTSMTKNVSMFSAENLILFLTFIDLLITSIIVFNRCVLHRLNSVLFYSSGSTCHFRLGW